MADKPVTIRPRRRRPGTMRSVIISAAVLLVISWFVLYIYALFVQMLKLEISVSKDMDRLFSSISAAENAQDGLTNVFDERYLMKTQFISHIRENEDIGTQDIIGLAERYLPDETVMLLERRTGTVKESRGDVPSAEAVTALCAALQNETGPQMVYDHGGDRYYCVRIDDALTFVLRVSADVYLDYMDNIYTPKEIIASNLSEGHNLSIAVRGGIVQYSPYDETVGMAADEVIRVIQTIPAVFSSEAGDQYVQAQVGSSKVILLKRHIDRLGLDLYHGTSYDAAVASARAIVIPVWAGMALAILLYVAYSYFLRDDYVNRRSQTGITRQILRYKNSAFLVLGVLFAGSMAYYSNTISGLSNFIRAYPDALTNAEAAYYDALECGQDITEECDQTTVTNARLISQYLSEYPQRRTEEELRTLSDIFRLDYIVMFDRTGTETVTDSGLTGCVISDDPEEQNSVFAPLKNGYPWVIRQTEKNELTGVTDRMTGVPTKDETGHVDGFLLTSYRPDTLEYAQLVTALSNTFDNSVLSNTFDNFVVESQENGTIIYSPGHTLEGKPAAENGFGPETLRSGFTGYLNVGNRTYFAASKQVSTLIIYTALAIEEIFRGRSLFVVLSAVLILLSFLFLTYRLERTAIPHRNEEAPAGNGRHSQRQSDGSIRVESGPGKSDSAPAKGKGRFLPADWNTMSAEEKLGCATGRILLVIALVFLAVVEFRDVLFGSNNLISYTLGMSWDRGFNIFAASAAIIFSVSIFVGSYLLQRVLILLGRLLSARAETVCRLLSSCVKYIAAIAAVYLTFSFFGMDVRSLAASVGFLALIVGFGAKSLITDIVAGLFIIFEGEFQVGDIVDIGGYRGMVKEIGLRTTKIVSWDKNVKIINNHNISTVVNLTMRNSFATVNFRIPISEDIENVEEIFREEMKQLPKKYPQIIGEPFFSGVSSFSGSGMDCWISAEVEELDRGAMEKTLAREVQEILARHNIELK